MSAEQDMRQIQIEARQERQRLLEQAREEKWAAEEEARQARQNILRDRESLESAISELQEENQEYNDSIASLNSELEELADQEDNLDQELAETDSMVNELQGAIQVNAKDVRDLAQDSLQTSLDEEQARVLEGIVEEDDFPGMDQIRMMADILQQEIQLSGTVRLGQGSIVDRSGQETEAKLLFIGNFTAAYRDGQETGFLSQGSGGEQRFALSSLPSRRLQNSLDSYMDGESQAVPMDVTRGGALRQLTHELSLREQISKGGPLVWPILFLLGLGLIIILERLVFLLRKRFDSEGFMSSVETLMQDGNLEKCRQACDEQEEKPLPRVIKAGLGCCHMPREEMESCLQEAILREIPPMERFLSTLGMLAAIAPLLGLLGTVTGMINTFQVITLHGTGDPRMMSGGISAALVTTMVGLSVAIPMLMAHTWLSRAVEKKIEDMEEKAVALVNMAHKGRDVEH
ncbi:MAG: MotA/TolQ/ExbB proton channel family protein [Desulfurivibrio sp.]|nr:MotA/TolQ/ExbB proton channel family protein [Desulfurivibrio sp.]